MKLYIRLRDNKFPIYEPEVKRCGWKKYREVEDKTPAFNPETQRLGRWSKPEKVAGKFEASREVLNLSTKEKNNQSVQRLEDFRTDRNYLLAQSDIEVLRELEKLLKTGYGKKLVEWRQELRDSSSTMVMPKKPKRS